MGESSPSSGWPDAADLSNEPTASRPWPALDIVVERTLETVGDAIR